ncbi:MAG: hypothetical protein M3Y12_12635 [Bacteroidota bacterium]|nr:hypothetical protein [Bacteroidota bacterium]
MALFSSLANLFANQVTLLQLLIGPVFIALGYVMIASYEGIRLDTAFMRYRKYEWIAGYRRGEWLPLPTVVRITVAPFNASYVQHDGIAPSFVVREQGLYRVLLSVEGSRIGIIAAIDKREKALEKAGLINQLFSTEVVVTP